ncbi:hypothetical protein BBP40_003344 [Aspergillus hancockii]|nr:hypothetical protein BBP40_003344 [Aspergillus hancockii]
MLSSEAKGILQVNGLSIVIYLLPLLIAFVVRFGFTNSRNPWAQLPLLNEKQTWELFRTNVTKRFHANASSLMRLGFDKSRKAFGIFTDIGPILVLSHKYAKEIRHDRRLNHHGYSNVELQTHIDGLTLLDITRVEGDIIFSALRGKLQPGLDPMLEPLSIEAADAFVTHWKSSPEWSEVTLKTSLLPIVMQVTAKIITGEELCRNVDWHNVVVTYSLHALHAANSLHDWPKFLRPLVAHLSPSCRKIRGQVSEGQRLIGPVYRKRKAERWASGPGQTTERLSDGMDWIEECAMGRPYDPAFVQIFICFAAIHNTTDAVTKVLHDICGNESLIQEMREEIVSVIHERGWTKSGLFHMKLLESVMKESQRLHPNQLFGMARYAADTIELSDGLTIPKGSRLVVSNMGRLDPSEYPDPERFDPYRFLRLRQLPGQEKYCQFVSSSPNHLGFGYGQHVCPGRFLASNEIKIILCHILLKYDIKLTQGGRPPIQESGFHIFTDPEWKICIRRRKEEIQLPGTIDG